MLRYGLLYEDIEWADPCIDSISEEEIVFNEKVNDLEPEKRSVIEPFLHISQ